MHRIARLLEPRRQLRKFRFSLSSIALVGIERGRDFADLLDIGEKGRLLLPDQVQSAIDATGESAELRLCEPPFFVARFFWIDSRTSVKASAIRKPGGWSGPPWSSLRIPRTAAQ